MHSGTSLTDAIRQWPTPNAGQANYDESPETFKARHEELKKESKARGTPTLPLGMVARQWPMARDEKSADPVTSENFRRKQEAGYTIDLNSTAVAWATPSARDWKDTPGMATEGTNPDGSERVRLDQLARQAHHFSLPDLETADGEPSSNAGRGSPRRLNPGFTAWLMGLRWWWTNPGVTSCVRSEMEAYRSALRSHGARLLSGL